MADPRRAIAAALVAVAISCTGGEPPPVPEPSYGPGAGEAEPLDALNRRFGRLRARMRERGYREEARLGRGFLLEGESVDVPLDLATDRCTTLVALAGGGMRSLDMALYDGEGAEVGRSDVVGEGALVHVCPQVERRGPPIAPYYLAFRAREGAGAIAAGAFSSLPAEGRGFDGLFDGVLAPRVEFRQLEEALAEMRATMRTRGLAPVGAPEYERVAEGDAVRRPINFDPGLCYVAVARSEGIRDVDLLLYDAAGAEVARDLGADAEPAIEICPTAAGAHVLEVRAFEGAGAVGWMVLSGPPSAVNVPPDGVAISNVPGPSEEPEHQGPPIEGLGRVASQLATRGFAPPVFVVQDAPIAPGEIRSHEVLLGPGCGVLVAAAEHAGTDLDVYLADAAGSSIDRDTGVSPVARVSACAPAVGVLRVTVNAYGRDGTYALAILRAPEAIRELQQLRLEEAASVFAARGYAAEPPVRARLAEGERHLQTLEVEAESCLVVAAAADAEMEDVDVFIRDEAGQLVASDSGPAPWAAVRRCAPAPERLTLEVLAYRGGGEVEIRRWRGSP